MPDVRRGLSILVIADRADLALEVSRDLRGRGHRVTEVNASAPGLAPERSGLFDVTIVVESFVDVGGKSRPAADRATRIAVGALTLDLIDRRAWRGGRAIELLPREFKLLEYLMRRAGQIVTRAQILRDVWHFSFVPETNVVDVHIGRLRRKLDAPGEARMLTTVPRAGFVLDAGLERAS